MKLYHCFVFASCSLFMAGSALSAPKQYTVEWLRAGCTACLVLMNDEENLTQDQMQNLNRVTPFAMGFIMGAKSMSYAIDGHRTKLTTPPDRWLAFVSLAPAILEFMRKNPEIPDSANAQALMTAFYYLNHPNANAHHKKMGNAALIYMTKYADK